MTGQSTARKAYATDGAGAPTGPGRRGGRLDSRPRARGHPLLLRRPRPLDLEPQAGLRRDRGRARDRGRRDRLGRDRATTTRRRGPAPAPQVVVAEVPAPEEAEELGFPAFATKNTTRVAGADPVANAAGVALAVNPSTGDAPAPDAVTLVDAGEWQAAVAAASLAADPVGAPLLVTEDGELPELTESALRALGARGRLGDRRAPGVRRRRRRRARRLREPLGRGRRPGRAGGGDRAPARAARRRPRAHRRHQRRRGRLRDARRRAGRHARATRCCSSIRAASRRRPSRRCAATTGSRCTCWGPSRRSTSGR